MINRAIQFAVLALAMLGAGSNFVAAQSTSNGDTSTQGSPSGDSSTGNGATGSGAAPSGK